MGKTFRNGHEFPAEFGFTGSAGQVHVASHVRQSSSHGGQVKAFAKGGAISSAPKVPSIPKPGKLGALGRVAKLPSVKSSINPRKGVAGTPNYAMRAKIPGGQ